MNGYKHILAAADLSSQSDQVLQRAQSLADQSSAKLSLIYVMEHSPVAYGGEYSIPIDASLEKSLEEKAKAGLTKLGSKFGIANSNQHLGRGSIRFAVINLAKELTIDLIVVGTHGHHGIDILLGSRANAILHHAQCDVLAVRIQQQDK